MKCNKCDKAYNKFQSKTLNEGLDYGNYITDNERVKDFITNCFSNIETNLIQDDQ